MEFAEWKKQVEGDYDEWKKAHDITKTDSAIKDYFTEIITTGKLRNPKNDLKAQFDEFQKRRNKYEIAIKKNGGRNYDCVLAFIKYRILLEIDIENGGELPTQAADRTASDIVRFEKSKDLEQRKDFYDAISYKSNLYKDLAKGTFSKSAKSGNWINFCSWLNKYYYVFDSWKSVSEFCAKYCHNENGDNYLYVRNLDDICAYYSILKGKSSKYKKELSEKAYKELVGEENTDEVDEQCTGTSYLLEAIDDNIEANTEEEFFNFLRGYAAGNFDVQSNAAYEHLTAIKRIYSAYCGDNLGKDEGNTRDYNAFVDGIYNKSLDGLLFRDMFSREGQWGQLIKGYSNLQKKILSKFMNIANDIIPTENKEVCVYYEFNKSVRYYAVLAAMIEAQGEAASPEDLKASVNKFLRECYVREVDENLYDAFDWFISEVWDYEERRGTLQDSCGVNTLVAYLQNE